MIQELIIIANNVNFPAELGLPVKSSHSTTDLSNATKSELNLDSTSLREAAFKKWVAKKKENKTFKKSDLVQVVKETDNIPSASDIRQVTWFLFLQSIVNMISYYFSFYKDLFAEAIWLNAVITFIRLLGYNKHVVDYSVDATV